MKNNLEFLQLTTNPPEDALLAVPSERMNSYSYTVTSDTYEQLKTVYKSYEESDEALAEDPEGWLVQLFDCESFSDFEQKVISYFGGEQKTVAFLSNSGQFRTNAFAETSKKQMSIEKPVLKEKEEDIGNVLDGIFEDTAEASNDEEPFDSDEALHLLATVDNNSLRVLFLKLFAKNAENMSPTITGVLYDTLLKGLMIANDTIPQETKQFMEVIVNKFLEEMRSEQ